MSVDQELAADERAELQKRVVASVIRLERSARRDPRTIVPELDRLRLDVARRFRGAVAAAAQRALDEILQAEAAARGLALPRRRFVRARRPPEPLRREGWEHAARAAFELDVALEQILLAGEPAKEQLPLLVLAAAILRAQLLRPEAWPVLLGLLRTRSLVVKQAAALPELPWVDLLLPLDASDRPLTRDGQDWLRLFPEVVTLSLLRRWQQAGPVPVAAAATPAEALALVWETLGVISPLPDPQSFARGAMAVAEDRSNLALPYALTAVASGELIAVPVPPTLWERFWTGRRVDNAEPGAKRARPRHAAAARPDLSAAQSLAHLRTALVSPPGMSVREDRARVRAAFGDLAAATLTPAADAMRLWSLALLGQRKPCAVSTLVRYCSAAAPFILLAGTTDPADFEPDQLQALCAQAARAGRGDDPEAYREDILGRLCAFASSHPRFGWPGLPEGQSRERNGRRIIRAALLSPDDLRHAMTAAGTSLAAAPYRQALCLGAPGGLRLSEMQALPVAGLNDTGSVSIRATRHAHLKSRAGRRRIPLRALLEGKTLEEFDHFRLRRARQSEDPAMDLFLAHPDPEDPVTFDEERFRELLMETAGALPHDLRHTALSWLALVLLTAETAAQAPGMAADIEVLTGWTPQSQKTIRRLFLGANCDPLRAASQLRTLAGHAEEATSFLSYIHTADVALGLLLRHIREARPEEEARRMLGLRHARLAPRGPVLLEGLRARILKDMRLERLKRAAQLSPRPAAAEVLPSQEMTPALAEAVLIALDRGLSAAQVAGDHGIRETMVRALDAGARELLRDRTMRGARRHRSQATAPASPRRPAMLKRPEDRLLALKLAEAALGGSHPSWWATFLYRHSDAWRPGVRFTDPETARDWLLPVVGVVPRSSWEGVLILQPAHDTAAAVRAWRAALGASLPLTVVQGKPGGVRTPRGQLTLTNMLLEADGTRRSGFAALRHAAFWTTLLSTSGIARRRGT